MSNPAPPGALQQEKALAPPPVDIDHDGLTVTDRAADVAWELALGAMFTTAQVAERTGLTNRGALDLMHRMSRRKPITYFERRWMSAATATALCEVGASVR